MPTTMTVVDSLGLYHTGAGAAGQTQYDEALCLGGERAGNEVKLLGFLPDSPIPPLRVDWISPANTSPGTGYISSPTGTTLRYKGPDSDTYGTAVTIAEGETKVLEDGESTNVAVRVTWEAGYNADELGNPFDAMSLAVAKVYNSPIGMDNVTNAQSVAGQANYRAIMLRAHGSNALTNVYARLEPFGSTVVSGVAQLPGSGAGTIQTASTIAATVPWKGWARITDAGALREVVYYSSRTTTTLTVPANGRARLGTSTWAGTATDVITFIP